MMEKAQEVEDSKPDKTVVQVLQSHILYQENMKKSYVLGTRSFFT